MSDTNYGEVERAVLDLEARRILAINANNAAALELLFIDEYVHVHASASVQTLAEMISYTTMNPRTTEPRSPKIRVFGNVAVLTGDLRMRRDGATTINRLYVTQVACKTPEGWKFASFQATLIPENQ